MQISLNQPRLSIAQNATNKSITSYLMMIKFYSFLKISDKRYKLVENQAAELSKFFLTKL